MKSFLYAFRGIAFFLKGKGNVQIHIFATLIVGFLGFYFELEKTDWMIIVLCVFAVLAMETLNTAIEMLVDLVHPEKNVKAGQIKDMAAGAVLFTAIAAAICGLIVFYPYIV